MDPFELDESKNEAAAALANSSHIALAALATGTSMAQTRRRLLAHVAGVDASAESGAAGGADAPSAGTASGGTPAASRGARGAARRSDYLRAPIAASRIVVAISHPPPSHVARTTAATASGSSI
jgi:hypothetical protein